MAKSAEKKEVNKPSIPTKVIKVGEKSFKFKKALFGFGGKTYRSDEVKADDPILEELVGMEGQTILEEV